MVGQSKIIMVVAGAFVFDQENRLLLQKRTDNGQWGLPGGFMELGETVQDTARREVFEETGLQLGKLELFGVYSGTNFEKTFANGDQVSLVLHIFVCHEFSGDLLQANAESLENQFFSLDELPADLFSDQKAIFNDFLSGKTALFIR
jgi:ADP-ribose pyrophosphatase YjhB (NUDIX family)